jgi:hypothetical protein
LRFQIRKRGEQRIEVQPEFELVGDDTIIGSTLVPGEEGRMTERFQVITVRDGKIADMQGCKSRADAERFARRHAGGARGG